jgi:hypothetical protein
MSPARLETAALRVAAALLRRALRDVYLPGHDSIEPHHRDVERVLEFLDDLDVALVRLDVAIARHANSDFPF